MRETWLLEYVCSMFKQAAFADTDMVKVSAPLSAGDSADAVTTQFLKLKPSHNSKAWPDLKFSDLPEFQDC
jgi:hypothetical protein